MRTWIVLMLIGSSAMAQIKPYTGPRTHDNADYKEIYLDNGKVATDAQAFTAVLQGHEVYRCVNQEVSLGKNGHSAAMKNVKKKM